MSGPASVIADVTCCVGLAAPIMLNLSSLARLQFWSKFLRVLFPESPGPCDGRVAAESRSCGAP